MQWARGGVVLSVEIMDVAIRICSKTLQQMGQRRTTLYLSKSYCYGAHSRSYPFLFVSKKNKLAMVRRL